MPTDKKTETKYFLLIAALLAFHFIRNYLWLLNNRPVFILDEPAHLYNTLRYAKAFINPAHGFLHDFLHANQSHWPPLVYIVSALSSLVVGLRTNALMMTNFLYLIILTFSLYGIGKKLYGPYAGITAALVCSFYHSIIEHSRLYMLDLPLTAFVALGIYCLLMTENFKNVKAIYAFLVISILGSFVKWTYPVFVIPPALFLLIRDNAFERIRGKRKIYLGAITLFILSFSLWHIANPGKAIFVFNYFISGLRKYDSGPLRDIKWFVNAFQYEMIFYPFFWFFLFSAIIFYASPKIRGKTFISLWIFFPVILFNFVRFKQPRFFMPVLPAMALITGIGLNYMLRHKNRIKYVFLCLLFVTGVVQTRDPLLEFHEKNFRGAASAHRDDYGYENIVSILSHNETGILKKYPFTAGVIIRGDDRNWLYAAFRDQTLNYYFCKHNLRSDIEIADRIFLGLKESGFHVALRKQNSLFFENLAVMTGFVYIDKDGEKWPDFGELKHLCHDDKSSELLREFIYRRDRFVFLKRLPLPNGNFANLYQRKPSETKLGDFSLSLLGGYVRIFYKEKEITSFPGMSSVFLGRRSEYDFGGAVAGYTFFEKGIKVDLSYPATDLEQEIKITSGEEDDLNIQVYARVRKEKTTYDKSVLHFPLSAGYAEWQRPFLKGSFYNAYVLRDTILDREYQGPGIIGLKGEGVPATIFFLNQRKEKVSLNVVNRDGYHMLYNYIRMDRAADLDLNDRFKLIFDFNINAFDDKLLEDIKADTLVLSDGESINLSLFPVKHPRLTRGDITIKARHGGIRLFYKDVEITGSSGITSELVVDRKTFKHEDAIPGYKEKEDKLFIVSKWKEAGLARTVTVIPAENSVKIKSGIISDKPSKVNSYGTNILLNSGYERWERVGMAGEFKTNEQIENGKPLDVTYTGPNIAGINLNKKKNLPGLLIDARGTPLPCRLSILNADKNRKAHTILAETQSETILKTGIHKQIFDLNIKILHFQRLDDLVKDTITLNDGTVINSYLFPGEGPELSRGNLTVKTKDGFIRIFYKDREITSDYGIAAEFVHNGKTYKYKDAIFGYKEYDDKLIIALKWPEAGLKQRMRVGIENKNRVRIKSDIESENEIMLDDYYMRSRLSPGYKRWRRVSKSGRFISPEYPEGYILDPDYDRANIAGIENTEHMPAVLYDSYDTGISSRINIANSSKETKYHNLYVDTKEKILLKPATPVRILDLSIRILPDKRLDDLVKDTITLNDGTVINSYLFPGEGPELSRGNLTVKTKDGFIRIFYKDREITSDYGIAAEFVHNGKTYKYKDAIFGYKKYEDRLLVALKWPDEGVKQTIMVLPEGNAVKIKASMESAEDFSLQGWYMNNLVPVEYKRWEREGSSGVFTDITEDSESNFFKRMDTGYYEKNKITIKPEKMETLPDLSFSSENAGLSMGVSNTNYYHNSRCVYLSLDGVPAEAGEFIMEEKIEIRDVLR